MEIDATANSPNRVHPVIWLIRAGLIWVFVLLGLVTMLGFDHATIETQGDTTLYKANDTLFLICFYSLGLFACTVAVGFWLARGVYRLMSIPFFIGIVGMMGYFTYQGFGNHYVSVSPTTVISQVGSTRNPVRHQLDLTQVMAMQIIETTRDKRPHFELVAYTKPNGDEILIPVHSLMKRALPEIIAKARKLHIPVTDD